MNAMHSEGLFVIEWEVLHSSFSTIDLWWMFKVVLWRSTLYNLKNVQASDTTTKQEIIYMY